MKVLHRSGWGALESLEKLTVEFLDEVDKGRDELLVPSAVRVRIVLSNASAAEVDLLEKGNQFSKQLANSVPDVPIEVSFRHGLGYDKVCRQHHELDLHSQVGILFLSLEHLVENIDVLVEICVAAGSRQLVSVLD